MEEKLQCLMCDKEFDAVLLVQFCSINCLVEWTKGQFKGVYINNLINGISENIDKIFEKEKNKKKSEVK